MCILGLSVILYLNTCMLYTFDYSESQLDRCQDYVLQRYNIARIIHILYDDLADHYITVIDCDPKTATLLSLL